MWRQFLTLFLLVLTPQNFCASLTIGEGTSDLVSNSTLSIERTEKTESKTEGTDIGHQIEALRLLVTSLQQKVASLEVEEHKLQSEIRTLNNKLTYFDDHKNAKILTLEFRLTTLEKLSNFTQQEVWTADVKNGGSLITKPQARLYTSSNYQGPSQNFNFVGQVNPPCLQLDGKIQSLNTYGTCVRLYDNTNSCHGQSMAFYPKTTSAEDDNDETRGSDFLPNVKSVSPCFENELDYSAFEVNLKGTKAYLKLKGGYGVPYVPDLADIGQSEKNNPTFSFPIDSYRIGYNKRVEYIKALIGIEHVRKGQLRQLNVTKEDREYYDKLQNESEDQIGHFIGSSLGPQSDLKFNQVFPQSHQNKVLQAGAETDIVQWLTQSHNSGKRVWLWINVDYQNEFSTRPTGMSYLMEFNREFTRRRYFTNLVLPYFLID